MPVVGFTVSDEDVAQSSGSSNKSTFGPGNYKFVITDVESGASPIKGTPRLEVKLIVEHDGYEFKMFDDIYLTEGAKWRYIQFCKSMGFDPTGEVDTDDMAGKEGVLRTKLEDGEKYMDVGEYYAKDQAEHEPLGPFEVTSNPHGDDTTPF
tara:strand:+ start:1271 stop:1723 length:453 start_codon:yes stop_codon:yes gene_type:complete